LDVEPPPPGLPEKLHQKFGFSMYSARYGNIYTVRQLLQLAQEAAGEWTPYDCIWEKDGKFYDALRPAVEPDGLESPEEVIEHRRLHIAQVKELFEGLDFFIFTLGLTEMWVHKDSGTVYPTVPGAVAGTFDEQIIEFQNPRFGLINKDFDAFVQTLKRIRGGRGFKIILTVSPVPLTATASGRHVLASTVYSKSILRSIAGLWSEKSFVDYFPSFEIVTNPRLHSTSFSENLRSVRDESVQMVMHHFFAEHPPIKATLIAKSDQHKQVDLASNIQCEEALMEAFTR
jgi:hypothetical protein